MKRSSLIAIIGIAVFGITVLALKCGNDPPETPGAPVPVNPTMYQRATVGFRVSAVQPQDKDVRFVMDWGDGVIDTSTIAFGSGDTGTVFHKWTDVGNYQVKALAVLDEDPNLASDWSEATAVSILLNDPPTPPGIYGPNTVPKGSYVFFTGRATDPDGDSIALRFNYGGSWGSWTTFAPSGGLVRDSHKFSQMETTWVYAIAKDIKGSESDNSETLEVIVDTVGVVKWWWITTDENEGPPLTSPVLQVWGEDTLVYFGADDDDGTFYAVNTNTGRKEGSMGSVVAEEGYFELGHPAFCAQTGNIIVGADDGELYACDRDTRRKWHWPGHTNEDSLTYVPWGTAAIIQNKIYIPNDNDSIFYFLDNGSAATFVSAYYVPGIIDAPVIDNAGNVIFVTDSGYVYKMPPDLSTPIWRKLLGANADVYGPVIDAGGVIYVGTGSRKVVALNPADGQVKWEKEFDAEVTRIAIGATNLYFGTGLGSVYAIKQSDGSQVWKKTPSLDEFLTTPLITGNGLLYIQDAADILYCMKQSDGTVVWACNCPDYGPIYEKGKRGGRKVDFIQGSPTLCPNGDIIVVGEEALFCVSGYTAGTLGATPWPKWQHDISNTGRVGGSW